jgi:hypothetical protein
MQWAGHVEGIGAMGNACKMLVEKSEGKNPLEDIILDKRILLKGIFGK